ncbi:MAG: hypothetical protein AAGC53_18910 [Actinomycetota bacterium]
MLPAANTRSESDHRLATSTRSPSRVGCTSPNALCASSRTSPKACRILAQVAEPERSARSSPEYHDQSWYETIELFVRSHRSAGSDAGAASASIHVVNVSCAAGPGGAPTPWMKTTATIR